MRSKAFSIAALVLAAGLALSLTDLYKVQQGTLTVYTTPALRAILESLIVPRFRNATGVDVTLVYVSAGEEYNRLRMSGGHPEADVFLHASPLFLEKGYQAGYFLPFSIRNTSVPVNFLSRSVAGGHLWYAFAWSPLAEVYKPALGAPQGPRVHQHDIRLPRPAAQQQRHLCGPVLREYRPGRGRAGLGPYRRAAGQRAGQHPRHR